MKTIIVLAAESQNSLDTLGAVVETRCDTIKEAKERARHYLTGEYARLAEMSEPLGYARVVVNGENVFDIGN